MANFAPNWLQPPKERTELRAKGRVRCDGVSSCLGPVIDLSAGGVRVLCRRFSPPPLGHEFTLELLTLDGTAKISSTVVRRRKLGWRLHELGVAFQGLTESEQADLTQLVRVAASRTTCPLLRDAA